MKFSIIVPVYNRQNSLRKCIDSILAQNFKDYELLIIDDGSTDETWQVLSEYHFLNESIRIFRQSNKGVSSARNYGLVRSLGEFIIFIDSDDSIGQGYLEYLESILDSEEVDGVILDYYFESSDKEPMKANSTGMLPVQVDASQYRSLFLCGEVSNCMWDKVIRRKIFIEGNIFFPENISICEDAVVSASIGNLVNTLKVSDRAFLYYYQNKDSLSRNTTTIDTVDQIFKALGLIEDAFNKSGVRPSMINEMKLRQLFYYIFTLEYRDPNSQNYILSEFYSIVDKLNFKDFRSSRSKIYFVFSKLTKISILRTILFSSYKFFRSRANL